MLHAFDALFESTRRLARVAEAGTRTTRITEHGRGRLKGCCSAASRGRPWPPRAATCSCWRRGTLRRDGAAGAALRAGIAALVVGAEALVRGASRLALPRGISPLVVWLTVVAFGTSSREMTVTVGAALDGRSDVAVGNGVASNIVNVPFILGVSALIVPLAVDTRLIRQEVPVVIGASALFVAVALNGRSAGARRPCSPRCSPPTWAFACGSRVRKGPAPAAQRPRRAVGARTGWCKPGPSLAVSRCWSRARAGWWMRPWRLLRRSG